MRRSLARAWWVATLFVGAAACRDEASYETEVEIVRKTIVRAGVDGARADLDVEIDYPHCPGEQLEIMRGSPEFAACMDRYEVGATVAAQIETHVGRDGERDWDVVQLGDCPRPPDPNDETSFDLVHECERTLVNGVDEGFVCRRIPERELLDACPWFARR